MPAGSVAYAAFHAGLVGPDPLLFDVFPPPLFRRAQKRAGNALHDCAADEVFRALFRAARGHALYDKRNAPAVTAYALGFVCHFALDATFHPLVRALFSGPDHTRFETALGSVLLDRLGATVPLGKETKLLPARPLTRHTGKAAAPLDAIAEVLRETVRSLFATDIGNAYRRSFFKKRALHAFLYDPSGKRRARLRRAEQLLRRKEGTASGFFFTPPPSEDPDRLFTAALAEADEALQLMQTALTRAETLLRLAVPALTAPVEEDASRSLDALLQALKGATMSYGYQQ